MQGCDRWQNAYNFLAFLDTRLDLGDVSLRLIVGNIIDLIFVDDTERLFGVQFPLSDGP